MKLLSEFRLVLQDFGWMDDAACRGRKDIDFFPEVGYNGKAPHAMALCKNCPVQQDCLDFAITNVIEHGIWGGMNPQQRKRYLRNGRKKGNF